MSSAKIKLPIAIVLFLTLMYFIGSNKQPVDAEISKTIELLQAQAYKVVATKTYPTPPNKQGLKVVIYSEHALTFEQRAQTAMQAAIDMVDDKGLFEVVVQLNAVDNAKLNVIGLVTYSPSGENTWGDKQKYVWEVDASKDTIVDGKLVHEDKSYALSYISLSQYFRG